MFDLSIKKIEDIYRDFVEQKLTQKQNIKVFSFCKWLSTEYKDFFSNDKKIIFGNLNDVENIYSSWFFEKKIFSPYIENISFSCLSEQLQFVFSNDIVFLQVYILFILIKKKYTFNTIYKLFSLYIIHLTMDFFICLCNMYNIDLFSSLYHVLMEYHKIEYVFRYIVTYLLKLDNI